MSNNEARALLAIKQQQPYKITLADRVKYQPADAPAQDAGIAELTARLTRLEQAHNNETGDLYQQVRALKEQVDALTGGPK